MTRSTASRRARNSASLTIGARRRPASRPSRRRCFLASSRVEPLTERTSLLAEPVVPVLASGLPFGSRTCTTVSGGSSELERQDRPRPNPGGACGAAAGHCCPSSRPRRRLTAGFAVAVAAVVRRGGFRRGRVGRGLRPVPGGAPGVLAAASAGGRSLAFALPGAAGRGRGGLLRGSLSWASGALSAVSAAASCSPFRPRPRPYRRLRRLPAPLPSSSSPPSPLPAGRGRRRGPRLPAAPAQGGRGGTDPAAPPAAGTPLRGWNTAAGTAGVSSRRPVRRLFSSDSLSYSSLSSIRAISSQAPGRAVPRRSASRRLPRCPPPHGTRCQRKPRRSRAGDPERARSPCGLGSAGALSLSSRDGAPVRPCRPHDAPLPASRARGPWASRVVMGGDDGTMPSCPRSAVITSSAARQAPYVKQPFEEWHNPRYLLRLRARLRSSRPRPRGRQAAGRPCP